MPSMDGIFLLLVERSRQHKHLCIIVLMRLSSHDNRLLPL